MSESEKKSGGGSGGSAVVLVEQSAASRLKQPFRPTTRQEEAIESYLKRSQAPAVPSVTEELKDIANTESKDRRESERAMSSEKQMHNLAKKLSAAKRRGSSPEAITMAHLEVETKKGTVSPQPIPLQIGSVSSAEHTAMAGKTTAEARDDDSITDEIADLRTPGVLQKSSEWEIGAGSCVCNLERISSIGPCFRSAAPFGRPSGIAIFIQNNLSTPNGDEANDQKSVINITVSKKCLVNKTRSRVANREKEKNEVPIIPRDRPSETFLGSLKEKLANMTGKIKDVLNA